MSLAAVLFLQHHVYSICCSLIAIFIDLNVAISAIGLEAAQLMDWVGLGHILNTISTAAKSRDNTASCSIIDHLASKLMALTSTYVLNRILGILIYHFSFH